MVNRLALALVLALAATAHADPESDRAVLGFRFGIGVIPLDAKLTATMTLGLTAEHVVSPDWRLLGEYEWLWLAREKTMPEERGDGQRAHIGARRRLAVKQVDEFGFYLDGDFGVGFMLANDNVSGMHAVPDVFAGLRGGYEEHARRRRSPSKLFDFELYARGLAMLEGAGMVAGMGMAWQ
jgi:hypothetical protein